MFSFDFYSVPHICFGRGVVSRAGDLAAALGTSAMVIYNGGDPGDGGPVDRVLSALSKASLTAVTCRQSGEPSVEDVQRAVAVGREKDVEVVIGLGGGSAIDAAKAVAGLLTNSGDVTDYMEVVGLGKKITKPAAPWIAIPTTAGTGAEATRNAVIGCPERRFKASLRSEHLLPRVAVIDPELAVGVSPQVTARCGLDALCQLIESYTSTHAQPITDALALQGIPLVARSLRRACADGTDLAAREDMALAALLSGITLTNAGLGAVHGLAAPIGGQFPAPHGAICGALLHHIMAANIESARSSGGDSTAAARMLDRYAVVGRLLVGDANLSGNDAVDAAITFASDLSRSLSVPPLGRFALEEGDIDRIIKLARNSSSMRFNPLVLSDAAPGRALRSSITD